MDATDDLDWGLGSIKTTANVNDELELLQGEEVGSERALTTALLDEARARLRVQQMRVQLEDVKRRRRAVSKLLTLLFKQHLARF